MRFAITGHDNSVGIFEAFLKAGWEPVKLFTFSAEGTLESNERMSAIARDKSIPVQSSQLSDADLADLAERGCDALIVAGYPWRIGDWRPFMRYAVNFHPSPLPEARGPYPLVRAIMEGRTSWAVTCHKLERHFDAGDILAAETFALGENECHESLSLKIQMASIRLAERVAGNFVGLWERAAPQGAGDYWPNLSPQDRTVDFSAPVDAILRKVRALGLLGFVAQVNGAWICVQRAVGWREAHGRTVGTVAHIHNKTLVIAVPDGYVGLIEWHVLSMPKDATA